jgi:protein TonB
MRRLLLALLLCASHFAVHAQKADSTTQVITQQDSVKAQFPGGEKAWGEYIIHLFHESFDDLYSKGAKGTAEVQFLVLADGSIDSITLVHKTGTFLDKFAVNAIKNSPQWIPATKDGQNIKCYRRQKLTFDEPR